MWSWFGQPHYTKGVVIHNQEKVMRSAAIRKLVIWFVLKVSLNLLGLDTLADYQEYLESLHAAQVAIAQIELQISI